MVQSGPSDSKWRVEIRRERERGCQRTIPRRRHGRDRADLADVRLDERTSPMYAQMAVPVIIGQNKNTGMESGEQRTRFQVQEVAACNRGGAERARAARVAGNAPVSVCTQHNEIEGERTVPAASLPSCEAREAVPNGGEAAER